MAKKLKEPPFVWKSHVRNLFDEIIQHNDRMKILHKPLQITMRILGEAAEYAAKTGDERMIGYFCRLSLYSFSDPEDKDYDKERSNYYMAKTKQ